MVSNPSLQLVDNQQSSGPISGPMNSEQMKEQEAGMKRERKKNQREERGMGHQRDAKSSWPDTLAMKCF